MATGGTDRNRGALLEERAESVAPRPVEDLPVWESEPPALNLAAHAQVVVAAGVVLVICYVAKSLLITVLVAALFAFLLDPIVSGLHRIRIPRALAAFIAVALTVVALYGIVSFSYSRAVDFVEALPKYTEEVRRTVMRFRRQAQQLQTTTETMLATPRASRPVAVIEQPMDALARSLGTVSEVMLLISFVPFLVYFMLTWQDHVRTATARLFRVEHRAAAYATMGQITAMVRSFIVGNLVIAIFMAIISVLVFGLLGLPYFYVVGGISGIFSIVPYLGVVLAIIPPMIVGVGQLSGADLLAIATTVIGVHLFALNVLYPKLLGSRLKLNPLAVTIALLTWGWLWGAAGLILAVPITGVIKIIFDHVDHLRPYGTWLGVSTELAREGVRR